MNSQKGGSDNSKKERVTLKREKKFSRGMLVLYMSELVVRMVLKKTKVITININFCTLFYIDL